MRIDPTERILLSEERIRERVRELGEEIGRDYEGRDLVVLAVLRGAAIFAADLSRAIDTPHEIDFVGVSSYGSATESSGKVRLTTELPDDIGGRDVLIVEDIYDTGRTLAFLRETLKELEPASMEICALLVKDRPREAEVGPVRYWGFHIPDAFVVGYGLDHAQRHRHLPYVGVLRRDLRGASPHRKDTT